jgi:hypothetical protein
MMNYKITKTKKGKYEIYYRRRWWNSWSKIDLIFDNTDMAFEQIIAEENCFGNRNIKVVWEL